MKSFIIFNLVRNSVREIMTKQIHFWCFITLLAIHFPGRSQINNIYPDTLNNWVSQNKSNAIDTSKLYAKSLQELSFSAEVNNPESLNAARRNHAEYHENYGNIDSAIYYMELVLDSYTTLKDTALMAKAHLDIKGLYSTKAEYAQAANQVYSALQLYEQIEDELGIANCYVDLCDLLYYEDKYQESVEYCDKAIEIQKQANAMEDMAKSLRYKASSQLFSGVDLKEALETINEAIRIYEGMEGKEIELMACINGRGNILKYMGRYTEAIADYQANYNKSLEIGFKPYIIPSIGNIGHVYKLEGKYKEALPYTLKTIELIKASGDSKNLWENYMHARDIYEKLENFEKAHEYSKLYSDNYSQYLQTIIDRLESEAQIKYETKKRDEQILLQKTKIRQQQKIQILYISIAVLLLISLIGMLRSRSKLRKKQMEIALSKEKLEKSIKYLKSTQSQLIQSEKMASLGELTAGIAHEIQNPLNFVNNFSELNSELLNELKEELANGNVTEVEAIANDLSENEAKITHHGKRADAIVKGMLAHSRSGKGEKEPTDLNALAEEYLKLSYHGLRAKDKSFNADFKTDFDPNLPKVNIVPQDIGRVLLNLINNAFQAVHERSKEADSEYLPLVTITTKLTANGQQLIAISDNGPGIPPDIKDKIFQPFFTTKPTGEGTGLGLSLSYDIVKAHGGELKLETTEAEVLPTGQSGLPVRQAGLLAGQAGTTFTITLPK